MAMRLISADNHIDMTYCPPDLWSDAAPAKWKNLVPWTQQKDDGLHWIVDGTDQGMWNGVGPGFGKYEKGSFTHVDEMAELGFKWDHRRGGLARPTTPEWRVNDLDRDGVQAEIIYGCLRINEIIANHEVRDLCDTIYNDWVVDFAKKSDPKRVFPLALIPNTNPKTAAAEVHRCTKLGLRGGDLAFKGMGLPL